jgi:hypothetical protein
VGGDGRDLAFFLAAADRFAQRLGRLRSSPPPVVASEPPRFSSGSSSSSSLAIFTPSLQMIGVFHFF